MKQKSALRWTDTGSRVMAAILFFKINYFGHFCNGGQNGKICCIGGSQKCIFCIRSLENAIFSSHRRALQTALSQRAGAAAAGAALEGKFTFLLGIWIPFIGFSQNLAWTYYLTLGTSLRKNFSFFSKSKMAAGGQKFSTRYTFSIFS